MKTRVFVVICMALGLGAALWSLRSPAPPQEQPRVALAGGVYAKEEPPGIVGLFEITAEGPRFTLCDTGREYRVEGDDETMSKLQLAYRSLRVQASDGVVAELYGIAGDRRKQDVFDAQGIRSVHPKLDGECAPGTSGGR